MDTEIRRIMLEAGKRVLAMSNAPVHQKEGHANFVTDADTAVQSFLLQELSRVVPGATFFAEEQQNNCLGEDYTFLIDPIDGTTNFFRGHRCSAISVALLLHREPVLGMVYDPYHNRLFHAVKGKGAFCGDTPIHVSEIPFSQGLINVGTSPYYPEEAEKTLTAAKELLLRCADLRRSGSAALDLCSVAAGHTDMFFEYRLSPWDYAAASFIISEAGGKYGAFDGEAFSYEHPIPFLAANAKCFEPLQSLLNSL